MFKLCCDLLALILNSFNSFTFFSSNFLAKFLPSGLFLSGKLSKSTKYFVSGGLYPPTNHYCTLGWGGGVTQTRSLGWG